MLSLEIALVSQQHELQCRTRCAKTASILGIAVGDDFVPAAHVLADAKELATLTDAVKNLKSKHQQSIDGTMSCFDTLNLVLQSASTAATPPQDRSPIDDVFANPVRAIHVCGELQLACFVHLELLIPTSTTTIGSDSDSIIIHLTALEYSRAHCKNYLHQEFGSWLLEEHIEKAVIATTLQGTVCCWNRFAGELYQYSREEAMGHNIMELTPADMTQEQGIEIMTKLGKGEHWTVCIFALRLVALIIQCMLSFSSRI